MLSAITGYRRRPSRSGPALDHSSYPPDIVFADVQEVERIEARCSRARAAQERMQFR